MAEQEEMHGRNLSQEVDEVKGKMEEMIATQARMEDALLAIKDTITFLSARVVGMVGNEGEGCPNPNNGNDGPSDIPVGMGYEATGHHEGEYPYPTSRPGGAFHAENVVDEGHASIQKDKARQQWMDKMEEKIKAIQ